MFRRSFAPCLAAAAVALLAAGPAAAQAPTPDFTWNNYTGASTGWGVTASSWLVGNTQTVAGAAPTSGVDRILAFGSSTRWLGTSYLTQFNAAGAFDINQLVLNSQGTNSPVASTGVLIQGAAAADTLRFNPSAGGTLPAIWLGGVTGSLATGKVVIQNGTATLGVTINNTTLSILGDGVSELLLSATIGQTGTGSLLVNQTGTRGFFTGSDVRLAGANTFSGGVTLQSGNLLLTNAAGLGTGLFTVDTQPGRTTSLAIDPTATTGLTVANNMQLNADLVLTGTTTTTAPNPVAVFSGGIGGAGGIRVANTGAALAYTFTGANSATGPVVIQPIGNAAASIRLGSATVGTGTALSASAFSVSTSSALILDNRTTALARTSGTAPLTLASTSAVTLIGNGAGNVAESFGTLTLNGQGQTSAVNTSTTLNTTTLTFAGLNRGASGLGTLFVLGTNLGSGTGAGESAVRFTADPGGAVGGGGGTGTVTQSILPYAVTESSASTITLANVVYGLVRYDAGTQKLVPLSPATEYASNLFATGTSAPAANHRYASTAALPNAFGAVANQPTAVNALVLDTNTTAVNRVGVSVAGSGTLTVAGGAVLSATNGGTAISNASTPSLINTAGLNFGPAPGYVHAFAGLTVNAPIGGSGGLVKTAAGALNLNGANTFTGGLTINGGAVNFTTDANLGAAGGGVTVNGGGSSTLTYAPQNLFTPANGSALTLTRPLDVGPGGGSVAVTLPNNVLTLSGNITGSGQFQKFGAGVLALTGTNTNTGNLNVAAGTLAVGSDAVIGGPAASLILSGGSSLQVTSSFATGRDIFLPHTVAATTLLLTNGNTLTLNGNLTGGTPLNATNVANFFTLLKDTPGDLVLTATSTFQGQMQVGTSGPAVRGLNAAATTSAGRLVLGGANGAMPLASGVLMLGDGETVLDNTAAVNGNRLGTVGVSLNGGKFTLLGNAAADTTEAVGVLGLSASASAALGGVVTLSQPTSGGAGQATTLVFSSLAGSNGLGTVFVRGTNLAAASGDRTAVIFGAVPVLTPAAGGILPQLTVATTVAAEPTDFATVQTGVVPVFGLNAAQAQLVPFTAYTAAGAGALTPTATATYDLTGAATLSGTGTLNALRVSSGGLDVGAGNTLTLTAAHILSVGANAGVTNGTLAFGAIPARFSVNTGADLTVSSLLTGTLGLVKTGGGVLTLSGASTAITAGGGGFGVGGGTLRYGVANALPVASLVTVGTGATLDLNNNSSTLGGVQSFGTLALGSATLTLTGTNTVAFGGNITGTGGLVKTVGGVAIFAGDSPAYAGPITILAGTVVTNSNTGLGTGPINLGDTLAANTATATLQLGATVTNFTNPITVVAGSVPATRHTLFATQATTTVASNITIDNAVGLRLNSGTTFAGNATLSGTITGTGGPIEINNGSWTFTGNNSYTGGTLVNSNQPGALGVGSNTALGSGPVTFQTFGLNVRADGGTRTLGNNVVIASGGYFGTAGTNPLVFNGSLDLSGVATPVPLHVMSTAPTTLAGPIINGTGGLTKNGPGELVLTATASTYSGTTTVNAGTLRVNTGTAAVPNVPGAVTINSGAILTGTGAVGGLVTVNAGGVVSPGNSPGVLTAATGAVFNTGAVFRIEVLNGSTPATGAIDSGVSSGVTPGAINGVLVGTSGGITLNTGVNVLVDLTGVTLAPASPYSFVIGTNSGSNSFTGPAITFVSNGTDITSSIGFAALGMSGNNVFLNFTPVPEPATVLAVAGLGLAAVRLRRRVVG